MVLFPENPVTFSIKLIRTLRDSPKCSNKPSLRQAIAICRLILSRFMYRGRCDIEDFVEIAVITSPLENQELVRKIAIELFTYRDDSKKNTMKDLLDNSELLSDKKASSLIDDEMDELSDLEKVFDDLEYLKNNLEALEDLKLDQKEDSTFDDLFNNYEKFLEEQPYKTALNVVENKETFNSKNLNDLNSLLERAKEIINEKINNLEPEDIGAAKNLEMLDEIVDKVKKPQEKLVSEYAKDNDLEKFCESLEDIFQNNFEEGLNALDFALKSELLDTNSQKDAKNVLERKMSEMGRNVNDLFNASKTLGTKIDLDENELGEILKNSSDLPFEETYQNIKNFDQYFGGNLCDQYLDNLSNNIAQIDNDENIRDELIKNPSKIPGWRKMVDKLIDKETEQIYNDYQNSPSLPIQLKNYADNLIKSQLDCTEMHCRTQLGNKISDLVNKTVESSPDKEYLKNIVKSFENMGYIPDIDAIKETGKKLNMTEEEILNLIQPNFRYLKKEVERNEGSYEEYKNLINHIDLSPSQVNQLVNSAVGGDSPNLEVLTALCENHLGNVINAAEKLGEQALENVLSAIGAGGGLDLLEQWYLSRHNISPRVRNKIKELIREIMIDLGIKCANSFIGSANAGPLVENVVIPYTIGDDFELIDLEDTINNLMESGKNVEMISNDDFLVHKTSQGLRNLVLELDISGSMSGDKLAYMALCVVMLVYAFKPEEIALTFFESNTHKLKDLDEEVDIEEVVDELLEIRARGGTCIHSALNWANLQFEKKARSKVNINILFTDADVFDFSNSMEELEKLKEKDVRFVMVVPKFGYSPVMAKKMVDAADGVLLTLNQWRDFPKLISQIITNQML